jgi:hypothetical protein
MGADAESTSRAGIAVAVSPAGARSPSFGNKLLRVHVSAHSYVS